MAGVKPRRRRHRLLVHAAGLVVPHRVVVLIRKRAARRRPTYVSELIAAAPQPTARHFVHNHAIASLVARGLDEDAVRLGTIEQASLGFIRATIAAHFSPGTPLRALHIGNYVGVSLAAFSAATLDVDPGSRTVSIDPNMPHLGTSDPQTHTLALLAEFGLQQANVIVCGYTFEKTPGTGLDIDGHSVTAEWLDEPACENVLPNLHQLGLRFDLALMDGSHVGAYARREVELLAEMLRPNGLLFLDDATDEWDEIELLFHEAAESSLPFERFGYDGRVGVLRRTEARRYRPIS